MPAERTSTVAVKTGRLATELRQVALPEVRATGGLLRVEASGVCGADVDWYHQEGLPSSGPVVLGHHVVGIVAELAEATGAALSLSVGDRVLVEEYLPCGACVACRGGAPRLCPATAPTGGDTLRYGSTPLGAGHGLWGGYSQYLYLDERAMTHRLPPELPTELATLVFPLANGIEWVQVDGRLASGGAVVVIGPGQMGLSCVAAARDAGAGLVVVVGRDGDQARLDLATRLGAHEVTTDLAVARHVVADATGGRMADLVVDAASGAAPTIDFAVDVLGINGRLVLGVWPPGRTGMDLQAIARKKVGIAMARGRSDASIRRAIAMVTGPDAARLEELCSGTVGLGELHDVLVALGSAVGRADLVHVSVSPTTEFEGGRNAQR